MDESRQNICFTKRIRLLEYKFGMINTNSRLWITARREQKTVNPLFMEHKEQNIDSPGILSLLLSLPMSSHFLFYDQTNLNRSGYINTTFYF